MKTIDVKEKFLQLRARNVSYEKISKELDVSSRRLIIWGKEMEAEIANLKALELEALYEKCYLTKEARIHQYSEMLDRIGNELSSRDLAEVPTEKLFDLFLKYSNQLNEEYLEPQFLSPDEISEIKSEERLLSKLTQEPSHRY